MVLFDECEDLVGDDLVDAAEGEYLRHMTLALEPHHRGAMTHAVLCLRTFQFAQFIVDGDRLRRHAGTGGGIDIQFTPG